LARKPLITDQIPKSLAADHARLCKALDLQIPAKRKNLLIATWNLREFGDLNDKWIAGSGDRPMRDLASALYIAEIVSRFDVVAIQEVQANLRALRRVMARLAPRYGFLLTDVNAGPLGGGERLAFLFDTKRVRPSGLACELVVPNDVKIAEGALKRQFARTPYAASFWSKLGTFILVTAHIIYKAEAKKERLAELKTIAQWLRDWAQTEAEFGHNLILLGDFNIDRRGDPCYEAFTSTGLFIPEILHQVPRTIFDKSKGSDPDKFYDQIAWFRDDKTDLIGLIYYLPKSSRSDKKSSGLF
jgi:hypothetical protein